MADADRFRENIKLLIKNILKKFYKKDLYD